MRRVVGLVLLSWMILGVAGAWAGAPKVVYATGTHVMGDLDSKADARRFALAEAKRMAVEEAGTYLESLSEVRNYRLVRDEILAVAAGIVSVTVVSEKWSLEGENLKLTLKIKAEVDTSGLPERIRQVKKEWMVVENYRKLQAEYRKLERKLSLLHAKYSAEKRTASPGEIRERAKRISRELKAAELYERGVAAARRGILQGALKDLDAALRLKPDFSIAYNFRGVILAHLHQTDRALADFQRAIRYDPSYATAYNNRGTILFDRGASDRALEDFNKALALAPRMAVAYKNRGTIWQKRRAWDKAIADYSRAVMLRNCYGEAYYYLAECRLAKGEREKAAEDFRSACLCGISWGCRRYKELSSH